MLAIPQLSVELLSISAAVNVANPVEGFKGKFMFLQIAAGAELSPPVLE
jgi:hypothetical protein